MYVSDSRASAGDAGSRCTSVRARHGSGTSVAAGCPGGRTEEPVEVEGAQPVRGRSEQRRVADDLGDAAAAESRQLRADVLGDGREVAHHVLGRARELGAQVLALGGDARGAGIEMALAGHVAAEGDETGGTEAVLLGAEERRHDHVATGLQAAVRAQRDAVAQIVAHQDLVDLGEAELPRDAHVLDGRQRAGTRAADMAADLDVVGARLGDARRDGADAQGRDQLDADAGAGVDGPQVRDELGEVLDGVDVVMGWRADERDARSGRGAAAR